MAMKGYLAMTAAEIANADALPSALAWMACHFSPYGIGLSNCPKALPPKSLLIVDDITPIHGHDPNTIAGQLTQCAKKLGCTGVLLDFQRAGNAETAALAAHLAAALPCPVAVSKPYAEDAGCPIFLPPAPVSVPLEEYLAPWHGREVWLETALGRETIRLTETGAEFLPEMQADGGLTVHRENALRCHYSVAESADAVTFSLWRTREDLEELMKQAEGLGVVNTVGLYQELGRFMKNE